MQQIVDEIKKIPGMGFLSSSWRYVREHAHVLAHKSELERGDFTALAKSRQQALQELEAGVSLYLPTVLTPQAVAANRSMLTPVLEDALVGKSLAQRLYATQRCCAFDTLPPWGQDQVIGVIYRYFKSIDFGNLVTGVKRQYFSESYIKTPTPGQIVKNFNLNGLLTFHGFQQFIEALAAMQFKDRKQVVTFDKLNIPNIHSDFHPLAHGHCGEIARKALNMVAPLMLKIKILDDYLCRTEVSFGLKECEHIIKEWGAPWGLLNTKPIRNLQKMDERLRVSEPQLPPDMRHQRLADVIYLRDLPSVAAPVADTAPANNAANGSPTISASTIAAAKEAAEASEKAKYREEFINGIEATIVAHFPKTKGVRDFARKLYKLHERGLCDYSQVLESLMAGTQPDKLLVNLNSQRRNNANSNYEDSIDSVADEQLLTSELLECMLADPNLKCSEAALTEAVQILGTKHFQCLMDVWERRPQVLSTFVDHTKLFKDEPAFRILLSNKELFGNYLGFLNAGNEEAAAALKILTQLRATTNHPECYALLCNAFLPMARQGVLLQKAMAEDKVFTTPAKSIGRIWVAGFEYSTVVKDEIAKIFDLDVRFLAQHGSTNSICNNDIVIYSFAGMRRLEHGYYYGIKDAAARRGVQFLHLRRAGKQTLIRAIEAATGIAPKNINNAESADSQNSEN